MFDCKSISVLRHRTDIAPSFLGVTRRLSMHSGMRCSRRSPFSGGEKGTSSQSGSVAIWGIVTGQLVCWCGDVVEKGAKGMQRLSLRAYKR
eukprot:4000518-Amphidinium_carterae.1